MKVRQGFVSNSSSSSFVVAFPRQPQSADEVLKLMFPEEDPEDILTCYDEQATYQKIAERVWRDIEDQVNRTPEEDNAHWAPYADEPRPLTLENKVLEAFKGRYWYLPDSELDFEHLMNTGQIRETPLNLHVPEYWFGVKPGQLEKVRQLEKAKEAIWTKHQSDKKELRKKLGLVDPPYDHKASDKEKEKYYKSCTINREQAEKTEEYKALYAAYVAEEEKAREAHLKAVYEAAQQDSEAFLKDNKGTFILFTFYSDDCEALMEHGEIFRNLPYVTISHH